MQQLSAVWPWVIATLFAVFAVIWVALWWRSTLYRAGLLDFIAGLARDLPRRNDLGASAALYDRIDAFVADVREFIQTPGNDDARVRAVYDRLTAKDESRPYLRLHRFEVGYSVARGMIEIFPLLGILGTVVAIAAGMSAAGTSDADKVGRVVQNFGESVISTGAGLGAAVVFLFVNACLEPGFEKLIAYGDAVGELVGAAKRRLGIEAAVTGRSPATTATTTVVTPGAAS